MIFWTQLQSLIIYKQQRNKNNYADLAFVHPELRLAFWEATPDMWQCRISESNCSPKKSEILNNVRSFLWKKIVSFIFKCCFHRRLVKQWQPRTYSKVRQKRTYIFPIMRRPRQRIRHNQIFVFRCWAGRLFFYMRFHTIPFFHTPFSRIRP